MSPFEVLADPVRRDILAMLAAREHSAGDIAERFPISQPAVSRHLKVLREAGLTDVRVEGQRRIYVLTPAPLVEAEQWLTHQRALWERRLDALGAHLDTMANRRERP